MRRLSEILVEELKIVLNKAASGKRQDRRHGGREEIGYGGKKGLWEITKSIR